LGVLSVCVHVEVDTCVFGMISSSAAAAALPSRSLEKTCEVMCSFSFALSFAVGSYSFLWWGSFFSFFFCVRFHSCLVSAPGRDHAW
jgi:hypothetical protein